MDITGKNVVITGGARGMGKKFAVNLKNRGARPYVVDVVQENLDALKSETGIPGQVLDVSREKDVEAFFATESTLQTRPMTWSLFRSIWRVRSGLTGRHESPRSSVR